MKNIELIIFDLDGTLVNSQFDLADAVNFALEKLDRPLITYEQVPDMVGSGVTKLLEVALKEFDDEILKIARKHFDTFYSKNYTNKTKYYEGVVETLKHYKNVKKAVYSNKIHNYTVNIIESLKLDQYFDLVIGAQDIYKAKPSPEGIYYILDKLSIKPENTIMIGDSTHDIHAAQSAKIFSGAVSYGYRPIKTLKEAKPNFIIDKILELKNYI